METINVITLGNQGVGKTCLIKRITHKPFSDEYQVTIGFNFECITKNYKNKSFKSIKYVFWDTSGAEQFNSLAANYIRDKEIVLLVFCDLDTLDSLKERWINYYKQYADANYSKIVVVANKSDTFGDKYEEIRKLGKEFCRDIDSFFVICSAKSKENIDNLEDHIELESIRLIESRNKNKQERPKSIKLEPIHNTTKNTSEVETKNNHKQTNVKINTTITNKVCC